MHPVAKEFWHLGLKFPQARKQVEKLETKQEHDYTHNNCQYPASARRQCKGGAKAANDKAEHRVGENPPDIEVNVWLEPLPPAEARVHFIVFCSNGEQQAAGNGKAGGECCDYSKHENEAVAHVVSK